MQLIYPDIHLHDGNLKVLNMNFTRQMDRWKSLGGKVMVLGGDEKVMVHGQVNLNWQITSLLKGLDGKLSRRPDGKFKWTTRRGICALEGQCYLRKNSHFYAATPLWWSMGEVTGKCERGHRSNGSFGLFRVRQCSDLHFYILGFSHNSDFITDLFCSIPIPCIYAPWHEN